MASGWMAGAFGLAAPWWLALGATAWRWRGSPSLDDVSPVPPSPAPRLSIVVPARDEARNIAPCVTSILASSWPSLELIVVDDHSADDTGRLALEASAGDARLIVTSPPALPPGWLGKQWACAHGATVASGDFVLFTDADVRHGPELHARLMTWRAATTSDFVSVIGEQEARTFWERAIQPFVFGILATRYGSAGAVNRSRRASDKIANGQCLLFDRRAYDAFGGHGAVRDHAAEDLAFAQRLFTAGFRTQLVLGATHMSTRMYASLGEIVKGWGKNVYAAGRDTMPFGALGRLLAPLFVPSPALFALAPCVALVVALASDDTGSRLGFGISGVIAQLLLAAGVVRHFRLSMLWALAYPLGAMAYLLIALRAVVRGRRIEWKGREYETPVA